MMGMSPMRGEASPMNGRVSWGNQAKPGLTGSAGLLSSRAISSVKVARPAERLTR